MTEVKNKIAPAIDLADELYDPKSSASCHLSLQAGLDGFSFCILDVKTNKFLALQSFLFTGMANFIRLSEKISDILSESVLLNVSFKSVTCTVVNMKACLVPNAIYDGNSKSDLLGFNFPLAPDEETYVNNLKNVDARNVFAVNKNLEAVIKKQFPNVRLIHHSTPLLESVLGNLKNVQEKKMFVHVQPSQFEIIVAEGKNLLFSNSFRYQSTEDFIYFVLFVCEQFKLNPEKIDLTLAGEIERNSALYEILHKYVRHVHFAERNDNFSYSSKLANIPHHFHYNLFSHYLCVS